MTISHASNSRFRLALTLGASLSALAACNSVPLGDLDWDLRAGAGNTSDEARQATARKPVPDANGVLSYPGYQLAAARRGETVAAMAARLGLNPDELARTNALRATDPCARASFCCCPAASRPRRSPWRAPPPPRQQPRRHHRHRHHRAGQGARDGAKAFRRPRRRQGTPAPQGCARRNRLHHRAGLQCLGQGAGRMERTWPRHGRARGPDADHPGRHRPGARPRTRSHRARCRQPDTAAAFGLEAPAG